MPNDTEDALPRLPKEKEKAERFSYVQSPWQSYHSVAASMLSRCLATDSHLSAYGGQADGTVNSVFASAGREWRTALFLQ
jgi:hypothetical protein